MKVNLMTNQYKSELKGFALDRALKLIDANKEKSSVVATIDEVLALADKIVDYIYILDKDIRDQVEYTVAMIAKAGNLEKIDNLILHLQQIKAELEAGIDSTKSLR